MGEHVENQGFGAWHEGGVVWGMKRYRVHTPLYYEHVTTENRVARMADLAGQSPNVGAWIAALRGDGVPGQSEADWLLAQPIAAREGIYLLASIW